MLVTKPTKPSPTSQSCRQHISSPTSVANIEVVILGCTGYTISPCYEDDLEVPFSVCAHGSDFAYVDHPTTHCIVQYSRVFILNQFSNLTFDSI